MMILKEYPSEKRVYIDNRTGKEIIQLTCGNSNNDHLYFTTNSFSKNLDEIIFLSDRGSEKGFLNVFKMELSSGIITQLTDEKNGVDKCTKTTDSHYLVYKTGNKIKKLNTKTMNLEVIYENNDKGFEIDSFSISPNKKYVGLIKNEVVGIKRGPNYSGFKEKMYKSKIARISLAYLDGSKSFDIFEDTHQLGHIQFAPDDSTIASFCHEGPWHLVQQRIWIIDIVARSVYPCFRQEEDDCVGHEFWTSNGLIFFDNRRKGHDGTITSNKKQAIIREKNYSEQKPYIGFADKKGNVLCKKELPFYCNHYHINPDNTLLTGDEVENIVLINLKQDVPLVKNLCYHGASWYHENRHPHPTFSWEGDRILFRSDCDQGNRHLYLVNI